LVIFRKGFRNLLKDRTKRIVLPFIFAVLFMVPLHFFVTNVNGFYSSTLDGYGIFERYKALFFWGAFADKPIYDQTDILAHYWFMYYLIVIYLSHFILRPVVNFVLQNKALNRFWAFCLEHRYGVFLLGLVSLPFQYSLTDLFFPPSGYDAPVLDIAFYGLYYVAGILLFKSRALLKHLASNCWFYFFASIPFFIFLDTPTKNFSYGASVVVDITSWKISNFNYLHEGLFYGGWSKAMIAYGRAVSCWLMCFAFIGLAHRFLNKPNPTIRYLADSAYWVYWIHMPLTFGLSKAGQQLGLVNSLTKSYVILLVSTVIIYWSYNTFVRYSVLGDFFMGRRKSRDAEGESEFGILRLVKKVFPKAVIVGCFVFFIGSIFHYNNSFQRGDILVEAFIVRKAETLDTVKSIDGITDKNGDTPLHNVVKSVEKNRRYDPLPILIGKASDVNPVNSVGRTPLFQAVRSGNLGDIDRLLKAGARLDIADKYGHTPAHVAAIKAGINKQKASDHYFDILKKLQENGADMSLKDHRGRTVIDCLKHFAGREL
jgi:glucan biosynthesis protein C